MEEKPGSRIMAVGASCHEKLLSIKWRHKAGRGKALSSSSLVGSPCPLSLLAEPTYWLLAKQVCGIPALEPRKVGLELRTKDHITGIEASWFMGHLKC